MKKNKVIIVCSVIICVFVLAIGAILLKKAGVIHFSFDKNTKNKDAYDLAIEVLNTTMPTTVLLYGDDLEFREDMRYKKISELNEDTLTTDTEYSVLIINDFNSTVSIDTVEYQLIKDKLENNKFSFYYLGNDKTETLMKNGILDSNGKVEGDLCDGSTVYIGTRITWSGLYTEQDKEIAEKNNITGRPAEFILTHLVMCYESNN